MADKVTQVSELKLVAKFNDNDTRTIAVDNPKSGLTAAQINAVGTIGATTQAILGDKGAAGFKEFVEARTITKKTTQLDLR